MILNSIGEHPSTVLWSDCQPLDNFTELFWGQLLGELLARADMTNFKGVPPLASQSDNGIIGTFELHVVREFNVFLNVWRETQDKTSGKHSRKSHNKPDPTATFHFFMTFESGDTGASKIISLADFATSLILVLNIVLSTRVTETVIIFRERERLINCVGSSP
jgi:hypothetical protein